MTNYVSVKPDLRLPKKISGTGTYGDSSYAVKFKASWADGRYEIDSVEVVRQKGADPIDGGVLRGVRVAQAFEYLMHSAGAEGNDNGIQLADGTPYNFPYKFALSFDDGKGEITITPTLEVSINREDAEKARLLEAARIHSIATAYGVRSLYLVANVLGLTQRTASRLILKAREVGLLEDEK